MSLFSKLDFVLHAHNYLFRNVTLFYIRDIFDQPDQDMPHAINVTPAEQEAIGRVCLHF